MATRDKGYYFTVFATAATALAASILFFPSPIEKATMYYYDRQYEKAYGEFEALYRGGDRTAAVVLPLVSIDLQFAQGDHAVKILQEYVDANPGDREAKKKLETLYIDISRPNQYLLLSKGDKQSKDSAGESVSSHQERLYYNLGNFKENELLLKKIIEEGRGSQENYIDLSYLLASQGKVEEGIDYLRKLEQQFPLEEISSSTILFIATVELAHGNRAKGQQLAKNYLRSAKEPQTALALIHLFNSQGDAKFTLELTELMPKELQQNEALLTAISNQLIDMGRRDLAYSLLKNRLYRDKKNGSIDYLLLALDEEKDPGEILQLAAKADLSAITKEKLADLIEKLVAMRNGEIALAVEESLPRELIEENPAIGLALKFAKNPSCSPEKECRFPFSGGRPAKSGDLLFAARLYKAMGHPREAVKLLAGVKSLDDIPGDKLLEAANLFIELGLTDEGLILVDELKEKEPTKEAEVDKARVLLAARQGKVEEVMEFLESDDTLDIGALEELFFLALDRGYKQLAHNIAEELSIKNPSPYTREISALSLIFNGKVKEGMKELDTLREENQKKPESYFFALTLAAKEDEAYRAPLRSEILSDLSKGEIDESKKREYAYLLFENNFKENAIPLFYELAQNGAYGSEDVQNLLAAWGKKVDQSQLEWIEKRAAAASDGERGKWLEYLVYIGHPKAVIDIVTSEGISSAAVADAYLEAAAKLNDKELIAEAITKLYPAETRLKSLLNMGEIARDKQLTPLAKKIYNLLLKKYPGEEKTLLAMGSIYLDDGAPSIAKGYFMKSLSPCSSAENLAEGGNRDAQNRLLANFSLGEIYWEERKKTRAIKFYRRALEILLGEEFLEKFQELPFSDKVELGSGEWQQLHDKIKEREEREKVRKAIQAKIYLRLKKTYLALSIYEGLIADYPETLYLRVDYAGILMDLSRYRQAYKWLRGCKMECDEQLRTNYALEMARFFRETNSPKASIWTLKRELSGNSSTNGGRIEAALAESYSAADLFLPALYYIDRAIEKNPINSSYKKIRKEILWDRLSDGYCNFEYRTTTPNQEEHFYRYRAKAALSPTLSMEGRADVDSIVLGALTSVKDGVTTPFRGVRTRGELSLTRTTYGGEEARSSFYFAEGILGTGFKWRKNFYTNALAVGIDLQKPDWENIQSTIERGTRDRLYMEGAHRFNRMWKIEGSFKGNRYNLYHFSGAALSWEVEYILTFTAPAKPHLQRLLGDDSALTINYQYDREKVIRLRTKKDSDGNTFTPLPLLSRATHTPFFFVSKAIRGSLSIEGYFGYLYNSIAKGSALPVGGFSAALGNKMKNELRFDYNHSASTEDTAQTVDSFLVSVRHIF